MKQLEFKTWINKRCFVCDRKTKLEVHHIDWDHNNHSRDNLVKLCRTCHGLLHSKLGYYGIEEMKELRKKYKKLRRERNREMKANL